MRIDVVVEDRFCWVRCACCKADVADVLLWFGHCQVAEDQPLVGIADIMMQHWTNFGRNFFTRQQPHAKERPHISTHART